MEELLDVTHTCITKIEQFNGIKNGEIKYD